MITQSIVISFVDLLFFKSEELFKRVLTAIFRKAIEKSTIYFGRVRQALPLLQNIRVRVRDSNSCLNHPFRKLHQRKALS